MINFWKVCPGGNPTVLLPAEDIPLLARKQAACEIMNPMHLGGEQVGYINFGSPSSLPHLEMMGGEMCVNATRAFALVLAQQGKLPAKATISPPSTTSPTHTWSGNVTVSGSDTPVAVQVWEYGTSPNIRYEAGAALSFKNFPKPHEVEKGIYLVPVPGISHLVITGHPRPAEANLPALCTSLRKQYNLEKDMASGCIWLDTSANTHSIFPVVWVRQTKTLCVESACGSGTLAAALVLREQTACNTYSIKQPSGDSLTVLFDAPSVLENSPHPKDSDVWICGPARISAQGQLFLADISY